MDTEFVKMLYTYNDWANVQLVENASKLGEADYMKSFGQAWGSVHGTLAHLADADGIWFARWHDRESPQQPPDGSQYTTLQAVRDAWEPLMSRRRAWIEKLTGDDLTRPLEYKNTKGQPFSHPLWWQLFHVANHGTDHRSHLSIMMTELGYPPASLDFIQFVRL
jgi:uncharacterized damage-inducible protein DinB